MSVIFAIAVSILIGGLALLIEIVVLGSMELGGLATRSFWQTFYYQAVISAAFGFAMGMLVLFYEKFLKKKPLPRKNTFFAVSAFFFSLMITLGGWVHYLYVPGFTSTQAVFLSLGFLALALGLYIPVVLWTGRRRVAWGWIPAILAVILVAVPIVRGVTGLIRNEGGATVFKGVRNRVPDGNVIIILVDALRADHVSCYGYERATTPVIDEIAAAGTWFNRAYAQSTHTFESVPSLLTSLYPSSHNLRYFNSALPRKIFTVFKFSRAAGLRAGVFAETGFLGPQFGWNRSQGIDVNSVTAGSRGLSILSYILNMLRLEDHLLRISPFRGYPGGFDLSKVDVIEDFFSFVDHSRSEPFLAYIHLMDVHNPYQPPPGYEGVFQTPLEDPEINVNRIERGFYPFVEGTAVSPAQRADIIARYDEEILYTDRERVGRIVNGLRDRGLFDNTLLIVTADHGEQFFDHGQWIHSNSPFEDLIRVPLIVRLPEGFSHERKRVEDVVELADIVPTVLDFLRIRPPDYMEGRSLLPLIRGGDTPPKAAFSELRLKGKRARSLVDYPWHLIQVQYGVQETAMLFNLAEDPGETHDLSTEQIDQFTRMTEKIEAILQEATDKAKSARDIKLSRDLEEHFRTLGYIK